MADLIPVAADVLKYDGAQIDTGIAGAAIVAGQVIYRDSTGVLQLADDTTAIKAAALGIALNGGAVGQPITYAKAGGIDLGCAVVVGVVYGVTDTAGGISDIVDRASGDYVTILGIGVTASRINLAINKSAVAIA
ncbi:MAG TPA: hypothetical protein VMY35_16875 [Phycisphaerae bacterium]|nr:hypothetical protein [Phycisphaerae bacterium]